MTDPSDEQLLQRISSGHPAALDELYRRYSRKLYVFLRYGFRLQDPEDLVHDVFMRVLRSAHRFKKGKASVQTWMYRIARNLAIDLHRHEARLNILSLEDNPVGDGPDTDRTLEDVLPDPRPDAEGEVIDNVLVRGVRECIAELESPEERQAVLLYFMAGKVYREIAAMTGKSISMARKRITTAQRKLKLCLEKKGFGGRVPFRGANRG